MSVPSGSVYVHTVFDGRAFVPSEPVDLPVGTALDGVVKPPVSQGEWLAFLDSVEGSWVGQEMEDPDDPIPEESDL